MQNKSKKPDREAVARCLNVLAILWGKKPPDRNGNAAGKSGAGDTGKLIREEAK